ncbi:Aste57867_11459 [Aphanomyces stellatus]|uniref:Aste57867_11459 protein n=1 Tax=Aphanomyces stellatus TaxID=120398 RepID=A0A485KT39_9STRA|nr:hypothetical protein As57867_011416 [Aphanomyces stellatus]VFT88320.1 Aste57867_11459 [Aphanomyces stellatus]
MVLAHRFYAKKRYDSSTVASTTARSLDMFPHVEIGGACIFLATKITEKPRKLRDVMNVAYCVSRNTNTPVPTGPEYTTLKESLLDAEQSVLRVIRFDMDIPLPYQYLLNYTKVLESPRLVVQIALTLTSDLFYSPRALLYAPHVIAAACIYLAIELLDGDHIASRWWYRFDTSDADIAAIRDEFLQVYTDVPPTAAMDSLHPH